MLLNELLENFVQKAKKRENGTTLVDAVKNLSVKNILKTFIQREIIDKKKDFYGVQPNLYYGEIQGQRHGTILLLDVDEAFNNIFNERNDSNYDVRGIYIGGWVIGLDLTVRGSLTVYVRHQMKLGSYDIEEPKVIESVPAKEYFQDSVNILTDLIAKAIESVDDIKEIFIDKMKTVI